MPYLSLKVKSIPKTNADDIGRGIVKLDARTQRILGIKPGDLIEIIGSKKTYAIVDDAYPADVGLNIIRMDSLTRQNCGAIEGENVTVRPVTPIPINKLVIAPIGPVFRRYPKDLINAVLRGRAVSKGSIIMLRPLPRHLRYHEIDEVEETLLFFGPHTKFLVKQIDPVNGNYITEDTEIVFEKAVEEEKKKSIITYDDIGGLKEAIKKIREIVELPMKHPELFEVLGIEPPKGVLLYGPPGTGKTLLAKAVANEANAYFISINGPEIVSKFAGEAEERLRHIFAKAQKNAPSIIFIDEIDAIAQKRDELFSIEGRIVAQLLTLMDGLKGRGQVIVIAATNRPDAIDPALRRPGRFDREIEIPVPDRQGRKEILQIHTRGMPLDKDVDLDKLAELTIGYTGADLSYLCKEAALNAIRRILPNINLDEEIPADVLANIKVTKDDFMNALAEIEPSAMREIYLEVPKVKWEDIGGLEEVKKELKLSIELPLKNPEKYEKYGIKPPRGILLYGPPGTGKTLLAKAVANEANANFIAVKGPEVLSKWVGESEKAIRKIFRKAKQVAPSIIFFDEIDAIAIHRGSDVNRVIDRVINQLLTELDGIENLKGVMVIAATNRPDLIDPALLRPGRFEKHIYIPAPDLEARKEIFKVHTRKMPLAEDVNIEELAKKTENYSGADIEAVCREAAVQAMLEDAEKIRMEHFNRALEKVRPSVTQEMIKFYERFTSTLRQEKKMEDVFYAR